MASLEVDPICVVIGRTRHRMVQMEIQEAARQGARLIEVRLDFLKKAPDFQRLLAHKPCELVATVRRPNDGGKWDGSEEARLTLLRQAIVAGFDWVDLETDIADNVRRFGNVKRIVSYHNFREVPADLEKIHARMCAQDADVVKVAVRAQTLTDNLRVLALLGNPLRPTVAFCMGDAGFPSRILGAKYGAPFTYAAFNRERILAPGMPTFSELTQIYHYDRIGPDTRIYGVVGDPVAHSLSPLIQNLAFQKCGVDAVYLPFRVPREQLRSFLDAFSLLPVEGYSVTIPHKEAAAELSLRRDATVELTRAANTLLRIPEGKPDDWTEVTPREGGAGGGFTAYNTDYQAALDSLNAFLPAFAAHDQEDSEVPVAANFHQPTPPPLPHLVARPSLDSRVVLVLGAGGVARSIAHALHKEGALVTIVNRTSERAQALAHEVGCRHVEWSARHGVLCDIVVNCTSLGMHPNLDQTPLHPSYLKKGLVVFDTVYTPEQTLLLKEARERGCHVVSGVEMFIRQAAHQFRLFTGRDAPVDLIRKVVKRALSPVTMKDSSE
jgi:3-dehydroquinate dehydratase/shikimate dehydrogenase